MISIEIIYLWLEILFRWLHVIAGIAWIGSSFYFIALDYSLKENKNLPSKAHGEAWQVHGGGFYHLVKYLVAPDNLPDELTWFKWEAYTTWISGFFLLVLIYFAHSELYLIDTFKVELSPFQAIAISLSGIILGWIIYDLICKSPIGEHTGYLIVFIFIFIVSSSYFFNQIFSGRGAFTQIGVMIGTIMVANVAMIIIPGQRKVVKSLINNEIPDPIHGKRAKQRSLHNNYLTLPVVFIMLGGHYPTVFATKFSWVIIGIVIIIGALIRHFFNSRHARTSNPWWTWLISFILILVVIYLSNIGKPSPSDDKKLTQIKNQVNQEILIAAMDATSVNCVMCHAKVPSWEGLPSPPKGLLLETSEDLIKNIDIVVQQAVWSNAMPPGNISWMEYYQRKDLEDLYNEIIKIKNGTNS